ncbi:carbohydrate ABC transporter permease [Clostridium sp. K12(2020)]|nr:MULTISPECIES: carbohydrate ABC transporter permease [unclassified Clostridium]MBX9137723.1 carbohydrate ABC transporter permease [Clostridium sp. K12(2020)]MBX9144652.1 carbohydrate ABC transporter permease [Clostridium sp. K13]MDU2290460.1 carbohydrate ABC transporter permease [Clostridium celatum]MDU4325099.1 carbohydrate ABC transporter permease [Clostridium celatum]
MELKYVPKKKNNGLLYVILFVLSILFLAPIFIVLYNSFKGKLYISRTPFALPNATTFSGIDNYINGIEKTGFISAFGWSVFITVFSTAVIVLFTSMTAWYITRVKSKLTSFLYYLFVFSMIVPFQMVMFTMSKIANMLSLDNPFGIIIIYLGFGAGLSVFMFSGFVKSIPIDIEEAAMIDGCNPIQTFFLIVLPLLKPIAITISILNVMWIWNDYLLPTLVLGSDYRTLPMAVQYLRGGYGAVDMGAMMAILVLAIIPIIVFYLVCQKHIIEGIAAGAVKG